MDIEFERFNYGHGKFGLLFSPPRIRVFQEFDLTGSGHHWERLLTHLLPRVAPDALTGTVFDCESALFVAVNSDPDRLSEIEAVIGAIASDEPALRTVISRLPGNGYHA